MPPAGSPAITSSICSSVTVDPIFGLGLETFREPGPEVVVEPTLIRALHLHDEPVVVFIGNLADSVRPRVGQFVRLNEPLRVEGTTRVDRVALDQLTDLVVCPRPLVPIEV